MDTATISTQKIEQIYAAQQANRTAVAHSTAKERVQKLKKLLKALETFRPELQAAIYKDLRKTDAETNVTELFPAQTEIKHAIRHIYRWVRPQYVEASLALMGTTSYVQYEAKGTTLIISPWNYPINLTICPLVSAIAAGCTAILKPSELTPHTSAAMKKMIEATFDANEIAVIEGDATVSQALLKLKFDHIFFTGAPSIGKIVMKAAAEHLTSVTLELGGKSPTIVDETANLDIAARRIVFGKWTNAGQTCIAPDYIYVHSSKYDALVAAIKKAVEKNFGNTDDARLQSDMPRIVNERHTNRVKSYLDDAILRGAKIEYGGKVEVGEKYIAPTLLTDVDDDMLIMKEEIFGPLLPIIKYNDLSEVVAYINAHEKPLALYIFSKNKKNTDYLLKNTSSGGVTINDTLLHIANFDLPFGGVNNSGIGKSHGWYGFVEFSNMKAVLKQNMPFSGIDMIHPPFTPRIKQLINLFLKWL